MCRLRDLRNLYMIWCTATFSAIVPTTSAHGESLPYTARVIAPAAPIHSGPGDVFYPTDTLPEQTIVEVYREQADGWCAIRPPDGSFSWVYSRHLDKHDSSLGEINKGNVASRIGSRLTDKRNAVQIRLKHGETVQIIGGETVAGQTWYKIAPPAGEFRWIHNSNLQRTGPIANSPATENEIVTVSAAVDATQPNVVSNAVAESLPPEGATGHDDWRASSDPPGSNAVSMTDDGGEQGDASATASSDELPASPPASPEESTTAGLESTNGGGSPEAATSAISKSPSTPPLGDIGRQLADVELRLSRAVAGPPAAWNIEALEREAEQLLARAKSLADRENIKSTLAKLDRFASIQRRYARISPNSVSNAITPIPPAVVAPSPRADANAGQPTGLVPLVSDSTTQRGTGTASGMSYDAVGILRPVISKRPGAPQFALVDERGRVLSFVTATPDVNLQPYIGHRVGVAGNRGFIPEFQRAHVTAGRVAPLGDRMTR